MMEDGISYKILIAVSILLFLAAFPLPYGFYTFIRIAVSGCSGYIVYHGLSKGNKDAILWLFAFIAILFNPIAPIYMSKEVWVIADLLASGLFAWLAYKRYKTHK